MICNDVFWNLERGILMEGLEFGVRPLLLLLGGWHRVGSRTTTDIVIQGHHNHSHAAATAVLKLLPTAWHPRENEILFVK